MHCFLWVICWLDRGSSAKSVTAVKTILRKRNWMSLQQDGHVTTCLNFRWDYHWSFARVKMSQLRKISNDPLYCTKYQLISILGIHHFPRISTLVFIWELRETLPIERAKDLPIFSTLSLTIVKSLRGDNFHHNLHYPWVLRVDVGNHWSVPLFINPRRLGVFNWSSIVDLKTRWRKDSSKLIASWNLKSCNYCISNLTIVNWVISYTIGL